MNKPIRMWYSSTAGLWFATCWKCGLLANGFTPARAMDNLLTLYRRKYPALARLVEKA